MAVNDNLLLYIEPKNPPSKEPVLDELLYTMVAAFRRAKVCASYRGIHVCSCGVWSSNSDYTLPNGETTNNLCIHYLAYHRDEISEEQLKRVDALIDEAERPTDEELKVPKGSKGYEVDIALKYLLPKMETVEPSPYGDKTWVVGWNERGMGRGDLAVIEHDGTVVAKVETNADAHENVHLITKACNHHNELIWMVQETLDMLEAEVITNVEDKIAVLVEQLKKIKEETNV